MTAKCLLRYAHLALEVEKEDSRSHTESLVDEFEEDLNKVTALAQF